MYPGVGILVFCMESLRSSMLIILSAPLKDRKTLLAAARFTDQYIRAVGQEASPSKCVLLSTCKGTRKKMKNWAISAGDRNWGTKLDVRDLGGHLDVTF